MNIFRLAGDGTHLLSFVVLLLKILATRSCRGGERRRRGAGCRDDVAPIGARPRARGAAGGFLSSHPSTPHVREFCVCTAPATVQGGRRRQPIKSQHSNPPTPTSPTGISLKTQELYTLVFVCRYLDLFTR